MAFRKSRSLRARLSGYFSHARSEWLLADGAKATLHAVGGLVLYGDRVKSSLLDLPQDPLPDGRGSVELVFYGRTQARP